MYGFGIVLLIIGFGIAGCNGLQRIHNMRKENHVKNQWCAFCKEEVKALEIREKDFYCEKRIDFA